MLYMYTILQIRLRIFKYSFIQYLLFFHHKNTKYTWYKYIKTNHSTQPLLLLKAKEKNDKIIKNDF